MKIVLAPDSFKGSLSANEACSAMASGILKADPDADIDRIPVADGGEGTVEALVAATSGRMKHAVVTGPLGGRVRASWGVLGDGRTAVIEMAAASGLAQIPEAKRDPLKTTSYGTGELIRAALDRGFRKFIIGLGGSATTDCGTGMAQALGARFEDGAGCEMRRPMTGGSMGLVSRVDASGMHPGLARSKILIACDVRNVLLGPEGAARVFSPQKGADPAAVRLLEKNLNRVIGRIEKAVGRNVRGLPGAGAAGGAGAGLLAFTPGTLKPGIGIVLDAVCFQSRIRDADWIFTGEGRVDGQTVFGKAVSGIAAAAASLSVPVIVIAGSVEPGSNALLKKGVTAIFSLCPGPADLDQAMDSAGPWLEAASFRVMRIITASFPGRGKARRRRRGTGQAASPKQGLA